MFHSSSTRITVHPLIPHSLQPHNSTTPLIHPAVHTDYVNDNIAQPIQGNLSQGVGQLLHLPPLDVMKKIQDSSPHVVTSLAFTHGLLK